MLHELTGRDAGLLYLLFPHLSGLDLDRVEDLDGSVKIVARAGTASVSTHGSPPSAPTTYPTCTPSPTGSSAITPLCWPGSPCPTHPALSKAKSARSNS